MKKHRNREILRFFPTLSASNSDIMASSQVSLRTYVNVVCVNRSSKGHVTQEIGTVKITTQICFCKLAIFLPLYDMSHHAYYMQCVASWTVRAITYLQKLFDIGRGFTRNILNFT